MRELFGRVSSFNSTLKMGLPFTPAEAIPAVTEPLILLRNEKRAMVEERHIWLLHSSISAFLGLAGHLRNNSTLPDNVIQHPETLEPAILIHLQTLDALS